jgi:hypothetical protein
VSRGQRGGSPTVVNLSFLVRSRILKVSLVTDNGLVQWRTMLVGDKLLVGLPMARNPKDRAQTKCKFEVLELACG